MKIKQITLAKILKAKTKLSALEAEIKAAESAIFESLKAGASVQSGLLTAEVKVIERRNVAWKPAFIEQIDKRDGKGEGEKLADRISAATKPSVYESLSIKAA